MNSFVIKYLNHIGQFSRLVLSTILITFTTPPQWPLIRDQLFNIGVLSLPVVSVTGFSTGMVLAAQSFFQLSDKGLSGATGLLVGKSMLTELGPILTAFMVTGRVGSAICAELGTMKVNEQIDALKSMAVSPVRYLIAPRFIAGAIMLPLLTMFSSIMGIFGGLVISVFLYGMTTSAFLDPISNHITNFDYVSGLLKSFFFANIITTISCYRGMQTSGGAAGVGLATTNSVVICYSCILISNFILTVGLNNSHPYLVSVFGSWLS